MFESLTEYVSGSPWTYLFLFAIAALDAVIPLVPSETSVILAGVLASTGDLVLVLVILFAAAGAVAGDNVSYWLGRKLGHRIVDRFFKGERRKQVDWAHRQVEQRGGYLIIIGRFIPGRRTAVTFSPSLVLNDTRSSAPSSSVRYIRISSSAGTPITVLRPSVSS